MGTKMARKTATILGTAAVAGALAFTSVAPAIASPTDGSGKPGKRNSQQVTAKMVKSGEVVLQRGVSGPAVTKLQTKLIKVGIIGPVTGTFDKTTGLNVARFNEKFRGFSYKENKVVTATAWRKLMKESKTKIPKQCRTQKAALCISKQQRVVRYYKKGNLVTALDARFGAEGFRTREGNFRIFRKVKDDFSSLYQTPMPWSMYFSGGQAVHYSFYFPKDGYNGASHGCVNIRDKKGIKKLWKQVRIGTFTKVY